MPHTTAFYEWKTRVGSLFGDLDPHHSNTLAEYSFGMVLARSSGLTAVVAHLAAFLSIGVWALRQRLRELYQPATAQIGSARTELDVRRCFGPLVRWAAADHPDKRLVLALDPTNLSDRFRVLCVAVLYRGCGLPVAWAVQHANQKGSWNDIWFDLLGKLKAALGEGWTVLVLTDRGLESASLFRTIVGLGWHPLMRVKAGGKFRPASWHREYALGTFVPSVGRRWSGAGVAYPTRDPLCGTLLASWDAGHEEPWLILTDLPPSNASGVWYGWRMWIEHGFRAIKRGCWGWHRTQMRDPDRVARLWAVIAVATVYAVEVGGEAEPAAVPKLPTALSLLKRGLLRIAQALLLHQPMPAGKIEHRPWPSEQPRSDPLTEPQLDGC